MAMTPQAVLAMCRERDIKAVDLRFMDFPGIWQHFTIPVGKLEEEIFEEGLGFDGSSIRGWQAINESDMLLLPQADTAFVDPFTEIPTLCMICNVQDPITREDYSRDPRNVARKAVNYLKSTGRRRHLLHRPRGRVLHLRRRPLRPDSQRRLFLPRQRRRPVESRPRLPRRRDGAKPRLQAAPQGRLLPGSARRLA